MSHNPQATLLNWYTRIRLICTGAEVSTRNSVCRPGRCVMRTTGQGMRPKAPAVHVDTVWGRDAERVQQLCLRDAGPRPALGLTRSSNVDERHAVAHADKAPAATPYPRLVPTAEA